MDELEQEHYGAAQAGWNPFKAISHAITKVVHTVEDIATAPLALVSPKLAKGVKGILHTAEKFVPMAAIPFIGPGAALLLGPATSLVKRVASGDNVAKAAIASTLQLAAQGDPQAKQMVAALTQARKIVKVSPHIDEGGVALATLATAPQLGPQAMEFIAPAASLVSRARKNDPQAQQAIRQILLAAKQPGNVPAVRMAQALALVQKLAQQCSQGARSAGGEWVALAGGCEAFVPHAYSQTAAGQLFSVLGHLRTDQPYSDKQLRWAFSAEQRGDLPTGTALTWARRHNAGPWRGAVSGAEALTHAELAFLKGLLPRLRKQIAALVHVRAILPKLHNLDEVLAASTVKTLQAYLPKVDLFIHDAQGMLHILEESVAHPTAAASQVSQVQGIHKGPALTLREALQQELVTA